MLVREDTSTDDLVGIATAHGILTARGGRTTRSGGCTAAGQGLSRRLHDAAH
ncbi:PEP-utilizing enzyme [Accumulibacter sp.]|uniref:PEP-utilizing enzyme n=1 Tax=Accumulibacter sp. TaxID=2053492 RepID=UPI00342F9E8E